MSAEYRCGVLLRLLRRPMVHSRSFTNSTLMRTRFEQISIRRLLVALGWLLPFVASLWAGDWPEFRGSTGQGHSDCTGLPETWSESENIVWKAPVPGHGWSTPVIVGNQIWMTTATENGRSLRALALSRGDGALLQDIEVFRVTDPPEVHYRNNYASPTPVLERNRVYVHYGPLGTAALDFSGKILWKTNDLLYRDEHGPGSSPVLFGDLLRSEEHTSELQSLRHLVCRLLLEK